MILRLLNTYILLSCHYSFAINLVSISVLLLQIDDDEKYNRKLESGLYTLQASPSFFLLLIILLSTGYSCS